jgi:hypothetical protein
MPRSAIVRKPCTGYETRIVVGAVEVTSPLLAPASCIPMKFPSGTSPIRGGVSMTRCAERARVSECLAVIWNAS